MTIDLHQPLLMENTIQPYAWGGRNHKAFIPRLLGFSPSEGRPYAELWIGAHPKAPSRLVTPGAAYPLNAAIRHYPEELLGKNVARQFSNTLPYLLKILSANEPLSIQTHPTLTQAKVLHYKNAEHYPDENHKPEIAVALTPFTALVGFKSIPAIQDTFKQYPEIAALLPPSVKKEIRNSSRNIREATRCIKNLYNAFIDITQQTPAKYAAAVQRLAHRLRTQKRDSHPTDQLFLFALERYGDRDIGLFSIYFLNRIRLQPAEALFTTPGTPHAYIDGNIIECMANSDNVVRGGMTRKYTDIETLRKIMNYRPDLPKILQAEQTGNIHNYPVNIEEFQLSRIQLQSQSHIFTTRGRIEIVLFTAGTGRIRSGTRGEPLEIHRGQSVLIPALVDEYEINTLQTLTCYRVQIPR